MLFCGLNSLKIPRFCEIARTREEELSLRKEIRVAESIIKEIEEEDRDIDKIEEKEISRDEQPRL